MVNLALSTFWLRGIMGIGISGTKKERYDPAQEINEGGKPR
jgi:hypothetical protein